MVTRTDTPDFIAVQELPWRRAALGQLVDRGERLMAPEDRATARDAAALDAVFGGGSALRAPRAP